MYNKDNLLNTNPTFDYSAFRQLMTDSASSVNMKTFIFTFNEAGTYVLSMSSAPAKITIITVVPKFSSCSTPSPFVEFTAANLISMGVKSNGSIVLSPDWSLVIGLIVGAFVLVFIIVGVLYYLRTKAWPTHANIYSKYRSDHNKNIDSKLSLNHGGVLVKTAIGNSEKPSFEDKKWSLLNCLYSVKWSPNAKIFAVDDDRNYSEIEAEDEIFPDIPVDDDFSHIPELAKRIQNTSDDLGQKLNDQAGQLNELNDSLKREVDDLKSLIASTVRDIATGNSPSNVLRIKNLLHKLKEDVFRRGEYETNLDAAELQSLQELQKLANILEHGPLKSAQRFVEDIYELAVVECDKSARDTFNYVSAFLHEAIFPVLKEFKIEVQEQAITISDELRACKLAKTFFDESLKNCHGAFPRDILDLYHKSFKIDAENNEFYGNVLTALKSFADRIPNFMNIMCDIEESLSEALNETIPMGNESLVAQQKHLHEEKISNNFEDLQDAVKCLFDKIVSLRKDSQSSRELGEEERYELLSLIEEGLRTGVTSTLPSDISQLLETLVGMSQNKDSSLSTNPNQSNEVAQEDPQISLSKVHELETIDETEHDVFDTDGFDGKIALISDAIKPSKIGEDERQESLLTMEDRRKEEILKQTEERLKHSIAPSDNTDITISNKHALEQEELQKKLQTERETKLNAMLRAGDFDVDNFESPRDKAIVKLAINRFTAHMRVLCSELRVKMFGLRISYEAEEVDLFLRARDLNWSEEKLNQELLTLYISQERRTALANEEVLRSKLQIESTEDEIREVWLTDTSLVNLDDEVVRLKSEIHEKFEITDDIFKQNSALALNVSERYCDVMKSSQRLEDNKKSIGNDRDYENYKVLVDNKISSYKDYIQNLITCERERIDFSKDCVSDIVEYSTIWNQRDNLREKQSNLHQSILSGMQVQKDFEMRVIKLETSLYSEALHMQQAAELNRRMAGKEEVDQVLNNFHEAENEKALIAFASANNKLSKIIEEEQRRQSECLLDYESELFRAVLSNATESFRMNMMMKMSKAKLMLEIIRVLALKSDGLEVMLRAQNVPSNIIDLSRSQLNAETMREIEEMKAAFYSMFCGWSILDVFKTSMIEMYQPCFQYSKGTAMLEKSSELCCSFLAFMHDLKRNSYKSKVSDYSYKEANSRRLLLVEKEADMRLRELYFKPSEEIQKELDIISHALRSEFQFSQNMVERSFEDKLSIQASYETEIKLLQSGFKTSRLALRDDATKAFKAEKESFSGIIDVNISRKLSLSYTEYQVGLHLAFNNFFGKLISIAKLEDSMREVQQKKQQDEEARRNAIEIERLVKIDDLCAEQKARREEARSISIEHEIQLIGLKNVLSSNADKQRALLNEKLQKRRVALQNDLIQSGLTPSDAEIVATDQLRTNDEMQVKSLEKLLTTETSLRLKISDEKSNELNQLKSNKSNLPNKLASGSSRNSEFFLHAKELIESDMESDCQRQNEIRERKASKIIDDGSLSTTEKDSALKNIAENYEMEIASLKKRSKDALKLVEVGSDAFSDYVLSEIEKNLQAHHPIKLSEAISSGLPRDEAEKVLSESEDSERLSGHDKVKRIVEYTSALLSENYDEKMRAILLEHETKVRGLQNILDYKKSSAKASLQKRLNRKIKAREANLTGYTPEERAKIISEEFVEERRKMFNSLKDIDSNLQNSIQHAQQALDNVLPFVELRLQELDEKDYDEIAGINSMTLKVLSSGISFTSGNNSIEVAREEGILCQQKLDQELQKSRSKRDLEIQEIRRCLVNEKEEKIIELKTRLLSEKADVVNRSLSDGSISSKEEIERKAQDEMEKKEMVTIQLIESEFESRLAEAVNAKHLEYSDLENQLVDKAYTEAHKQSQIILNAKENAQAMLDKLKMDHSIELKQLEDSFAGKRQSRETALKNRLSERKAKKLKEAEFIVSEEEKTKVLADLAIEEQVELLKLQKSCDEEEDSLRNLHQRNLEKAYFEAVEKTKNLEVEASVALARVTALSAAKDAEKRTQDDLKAREIQRMKDQHAQELERSQKESDNLKMKGHSHLESRLAEKRARKEKLLKEEEDRALKDLARTQEEERKKEEFLKSSKAVWTAALNVATEKAALEGFTGKVFEEYLVAETIGKKLVPDQQINDLIKIILEDKHSIEEKELLNAQYEERVALLKPAMSKIENEMEIQREALINGLVSDGADETRMKAEVAKFAEEYANTQRTEEHRLIGAMESVHMKQQTDLKLKQMQEITKRVVLYSDPKNVETLLATAGEAQLQEMANYRAVLETEKRQREEKFAIERNEAEEKMRKENEEAMMQMHLRLQAEQAKAEEEIDRKKKDLARKKEEQEKKQLEALENIHSQEKARILNDFEKEKQAADNVRRASMVSQQERLAKRRAGRQSVVTENSLALKNISNTIADGPVDTPIVGDVLKSVSSASPVQLPASVSSSLSLIESKLIAIEKVIASIGQGNEMIPIRPGLSLPFVDFGDPSCGHTLEVLPDKAIQVQVIFQLYFLYRRLSIILNF